MSQVNGSGGFKMDHAVVVMAMNRSIAALHMEAEHLRAFEMGEASVALARAAERLSEYRGHFMAKMERKVVVPKLVMP